MTKWKKMAKINTMRVNQNLTITLFLSFIVHLFLLNNFNHFRLNTPAPMIKPIKVEKITQDEIAKYRRVGVRDGRKSNMFTMKTPVAKSQAKSKNSLKRNAEKKLDLRKLALGNNKGTITKEAVSRKQHREKRSENAITYKKNREIKMLRQQQQLQQDMYNNLPPGSDVKQLMGKSGFNFKFEPVEGVSEDELNSTEKTFFSFQKRTFERYYLSFIKTYNQFSLEKPLIKKALMQGNHLLTGQIRFDKQGNIISIRILKSSPDDDIHDLFEKTLKTIGKMPNPPEAFIKNKDEFSIYYQLHIKR